MRLRTFVRPDELTGEAALQLAARIASRPLSRVRGVYLSLANARSVDATGVAVLVRLYSQLESAGKEFGLLDVPPEIDDDLREFGLDFLTRAPAARSGAFALRRRAAIA